MRKVDVYYGDVFAGQLVELSRGNYEFTYDDAFRADGSTPPVSVNLPKCFSCRRQHPSCVCQLAQESEGVSLRAHLPRVHQHVA